MNHVYYQQDCVTCHTSNKIIDLFSIEDVIIFGHRNLVICHCFFGATWKRRSTQGVTNLFDHCFSSFRKCSMNSYNNDTTNNSQINYISSIKFSKKKHIGSTFKENILNEIQVFSKKTVEFLLLHTWTLDMKRFWRMCDQIELSNKKLCIFNDNLEIFQSIWNSFWIKWCWYNSYFR